jgi:hypothetical protein
METEKSEKLESENVESDTPRTDAHYAATKTAWPTEGDIKFAKKLEREIAYLREVCKETRVLLDGAYDLVEIHGGGSPYNDKWRKNWMEKARSFGATPSL